MTRRILLAAGIALVTGCASAVQETEETAENVADEVVDVADDVEAESDVRVGFRPLNSSGASGHVMLVEDEDDTRITVNLNASPGDHPGHIHQGTCESIGSVVQPLQTVTVGATGEGTSETEVDRSIEDLLNGTFVIAYHGEGGAPIVCAPIMEA